MHLHLQTILEFVGLLIGSGALVFGASLISTDDFVKYLISMGVLDSAGGIKAPAVVAKTADYTIVTGTDPSGTLFTNRGAVGAVNFTLPAPTPAIAGTYYEFLGVADQSILVKTATVDTLIGLNDVAADSVAMSTAGLKIGGHMRVVCDGTQWAAYGDAVGITFTLAT